MAVERTLSIIKPDAVANNVMGQIIARFESSGLKVVGAKMIQMTPEMAGQFYDVHEGKPFYEELVKYMCSAPIFVQVLEGEDAIMTNRSVMGATNPIKAAPGTIRKDFAKNIQANAVHGSDAAETAAREIAFFFSDGELCDRTPVYFPQK